MKSQSDLRQRFINMLNNGQIDGQFLFDYYFNNCHKKKCLTTQEFEQYFPMYWQTNNNSIIKNLKKEYSVISVFNKKNELIKYL